MDLEDNARNAAVDAVTDLVNGGDVQFTTAADLVASTVPLNNPAFTGSAVNGSKNLSTTPDVPTDPSAAGQTGQAITKAKWRTSGAAQVWENTVSGSGGGGEITFGSANDIIEPLSEVQLTSFTYTQPI